MIHFTKGNMMTSIAEALVNTVNTVGVMGKGIALVFKLRYPNMFDINLDLNNYIFLLQSYLILAIIV